MPAPRKPKLRKGRSRGARGQVERGLKTTEAAIALRIEGLSYEAIGQQLGISKAGAAKACDRGVVLARDHIVADTTDLLKGEYDKLDAAERAIWPAVVAGAPKAVETLVKIMHRRSRMRGWDAPEKIDATVHRAKVIVLPAEEKPPDGDGHPALEPAPGPADEVPGV